MQLFSAGVLLALLFLSTLAVQAVSVVRPRIPCLTTNVDFIPLQEGLQHLAQAANISSTVLHLKLPGVECAGSYVSNEGHILSAAHCLQPCIDQIRRENPRLISQAQASASVRREQLKCDININGVNTQVRIHLMNSCALDYHDLWKNPSAPESCKQNDLAVIQAVNPPANTACLTMATTAPPLNTEVVSIGVPGATHRRNHRQTARDARGSELSLSRGSVVEQDFCSLLQEDPRRPGVTVSGVHPLPRNLLRNLRSHGYIQVTADGVQGSSGGPVLNSNGHIVGVNAAVVFSDPTNYECSGSLFAAPLTHLTREISSWNPEFNMTTLSCRNPSAPAPIPAIKEPRGDRQSK